MNCDLLFKQGKRLGKYKWLLFDADGTLFDYEKSETHALTETFKQEGLIFKDEHLLRYKSINGALWVMFEQGRVTPGMIKVRRFSLLAEQMELNCDPERMSRNYLVNLSKCTFLIENAAEVLEKLNKKYRLAIITNGLTDVQRPRFKDSAIYHFMEKIIISEEIGAAKPDPAIFDKAFEIMGNPDKSEVLMIGDSFTSDITGALNYGIDSCWYNAKNYDKGNNENINYVINNLSQLLDILN